MIAARADIPNFLMGPSLPLRSTLGGATGSASGYSATSLVLACPATSGSRSAPCTGPTIPAPTVIGRIAIPLPLMTTILSAIGPQSGE
jgi:hypothetical protein